MDAAAALAEFAPLGTPEPEAPPARWPALVKVAFRFWSIYFGLYILTTQMVGGFLPFLQFDPGSLGPVPWLVTQVARYVFGITAPLVISGSGSGDKTFDWLHAFTFLIIAAVLTSAWSVAARRVANHGVAHRRFVVFLRFALGTTLLSYGAAKFIPLQMSYPGLTRLLEPYGQFSPMGVLWASIGASPSYEIFTGIAEATAGVLLFIPWTARLGAVMSLACMIQVFMLNMTYDVPVKLFSFHLVLMSLYLLMPDLKQLASAVIDKRVTGRKMAIAQVVIAMLLLGNAVYGSISAWTLYGGGAPKSPLYGVWVVTQMSIDGVDRLPLINDYERWRRVIFDRPTQVSFQRMDDTFVHYPARIDTAAKSIVLTKNGDTNWKASLAFEQVTPSQLNVSGDMDQRTIRMHLVLFPRDRFPLASRGFNWIQEYPFNR